MNPEHADDLKIPTDRPGWDTRISHALVDIVDQVHDLKDAIATNVGNEISKIGAAVMDVHMAIVDQLEGALAQACSLEGVLHGELQAWIEAQFAIVQATVDEIEGRLAKERKRLNRAAGQAIKGTANAMPPIAVQPRPQSEATQETTADSASGGEVPPASSLSEFQPFPSPPGYEQVQGLLIALAEPDQFAQLELFPSEMWQRDSGMPIFVSLSATPLTRATIPTFRPAESGLQADGLLFVNLTREMPLDALGQQIRDFGVSTDGMALLTRQEAYNASTALYSEPVTRTAWEVYGLTLPDWNERNDPAAMPPIAAELLAGGTGIPPPLPIPGAPPAPAPNPQNLVPPTVVQQLARIAGAAAGVPTDIDALIARLKRELTPDWCALLAPALRWMQLDPERMPPCADFETTRRYLSARAGETNMNTADPDLQRLGGNSRVR